ncbi:hypothetical protein ABC345_21020 [Shouchella sp. 1P09AA]|uniref:hypothetical protein n=1 Tax=unclassified Shouchella TaxID=2893065 RepID=UPI0039A2750C
MLYVNFTRGIHPKIKKHERIPFPQAVELSEEIEMEMREKGEKIDSYFYVIDTEFDEEMYEGSFTFGAYEAPNLFMHIKGRLPKIRVNKEKEKIRLGFIAEMEELVEERFKIEEDFDPKEKNVDWDKVSRLKTWQRKTVYGLTGFFAIATFAVSGYFFTQLANINQSYQVTVASAEEHEEVKDYYEEALLGNHEGLKSYLETMPNDQMSNSERNLYAGYIADTGEFEQVNSLFGDDHSLVANFLVMNKEVEILRAYHEEFPTNEGAFDLAYTDANYEEAVQVEDFEVTQERSRKRANAFLQLDNPSQAEEELSRHGATEEQSGVLNQYTSIQNQIDEINEEIDGLDDEDDEDEINDLEEDRTQLQEELNNLKI